MAEWRTKEASVRTTLVLILLEDSFLPLSLQCFQYLNSIGIIESHTLVAMKNLFQAKRKHKGESKRKTLKRIRTDTALLQPRSLATRPPDRFAYEL